MCAAIQHENNFQPLRPIFTSCILHEISTVDNQQYSGEANIIWDSVVGEAKIFIQKNYDHDVERITLHDDNKHDGDT